MGYAAVACQAEVAPPMTVYKSPYSYIMPPQLDTYYTAAFTYPMMSPSCDFYPDAAWYKFPFAPVMDTVGLQWFQLKPPLKIRHAPEISLWSWCRPGTDG